MHKTVNTIANTNSRRCSDAIDRKNGNNFIKKHQLSAGPFEAG
jgi:hypothetical protein